MPENERSRFSALINEMYEQSGCTTKKDYAAVIGVTDDTLTNWLNGGYTDKIDNWIKVARVRGWTLDQLKDYVFDSVEPISLGKFDPARLYTATVPQVLQTLQICSNILNKDFSAALGKLSLTNPNHTAVTMCDLDTLRRLMQAEQIKRQKNNAQFAETLGVSVEFLESFYAGRPVLFDDLAIDAVAQGLPDPEGVYGNWRYIYELLGQTLDGSSQTAQHDRPSLNGNAI